MSGSDTKRMVKIAAVGVLIVFIIVAWPTSEPKSKPQKVYRPEKAGGDAEPQNVPPQVQPNVHVQIGDNPLDIVTEDTENDDSDEPVPPPVIEHNHDHGVAEQPNVIDAQVPPQAESWEDPDTRTTQAEEAAMGRPLPNGNDEETSSDTDTSITSESEDEERVDDKGDTANAKANEAEANANAKENGVDANGIVDDDNDSGDDSESLGDAEITYTDEELFAFADQLVADAHNHRKSLTPPKCFDFEGEQICDYIHGLKSKCWNISTGESFCWPHVFQTGLAKGGSTLLYQYFLQHDDIAQPSKKEPQYWGRKSEDGLAMGWKKLTLRQYLESTFKITYNRLLNDPDAVTIDASPSVFTGNPITPERLYSFIPDAKIVVTTRNPTIRSYSDYWHFHRYNKNDEGMHELRELSSRYLSELRSCNANRENKTWPFDPKCTHEVSFAGKAMPGKSPRMTWDLLVYHLIRWYHYFPPENVLIVRLEDVGRDPVTELKRIFKHFDLPEQEVEPAPRKVNENKYPDIPEDMKAEWDAFFEPHNRMLAHVLNDERFLWKS